MLAFQGYKLTKWIYFLFLLAPLAHSKPVTALHWWTSNSEQAAEAVLVEAFAERGFDWQPVAVSGGAGEGALKVLRAKVLSGESPDIAQVVGPSIRDWAKLGFFHTQAKSSEYNAWPRALAAQVLPLVSLDGEPFAIPTSIHRINTLVYNQALFEQLNITPAETWQGFIEQLEQIQAAGVTPLAQSSQPWQLATLFEVIMAATLDTSQYLAVMQGFDANVILGSDMRLVFERFRQLQPFISNEATRDWQHHSQAIAEGKAAMQVMGDWAKAELALQPTSSNFALGCSTFLQSSKHVYSVDSFVIFNHVADDVAREISLLLSDPNVQARFSSAKGTIPARSDVPVDYDDCSAQSFEDFHSGDALPSMVHRAANNEEARNVFIHVVDRFYSDRKQTPEQAQQRLANELAALLSQ
ncbi:ABC transporter substrate-binding protein [Salinibius halmophilus]|uniref:ABC transporter substrate-binding protein n=1 Tax=Salinibius halmophilus TaxID=1853216 RepID=UPI000E666C8B|nr:ABC transporter substrate-binding protein [Salinibius halmophilus]